MSRPEGTRASEFAFAAVIGVAAAVVLAALLTPQRAEAAFPGANGKIAFVSGRDGNQEIYGMNPDGSGQTRLTNNSATDFLPAFSADGQKIAFTSDRDGFDEIYAMNADGSSQTRLTNNSATDQQPAFSPDGQKIAFTSNRDGNFEVYVMNADGSGQARLTSNTARDLTPAFSPDGQKISFVSERDGNQEIYVMNADGSGQARLTSNSATDFGPAFSPDGQKIAFESDRDGNSEVYVMNSDGSGQLNRTNNPALDLEPDWSPAPCGTAAATSARAASDQCPVEGDSLCDEPQAAAGTVPAEDEQLTCSVKVTPPCSTQHTPGASGGDDLELHEGEVWTVRPIDTLGRAQGQNLTTEEVPLPETLTGPPDTASPLLMGVSLTHPDGSCEVTAGEEAQAQGDDLILSRPGPHLWLDLKTAVHYEYVLDTDTPTLAVCTDSFRSQVPAGFEPVDPDPNDGKSWKPSSVCVTRSQTHFSIVHPAAQCSSLDASGFPDQTGYINQYAAGEALNLDVASDGKKGGAACGPSSQLMAMRALKVEAGQALTLPGLKSVYSNTVSGVYQPTDGKAELKSLGWTGVKVKWPLDDSDPVQRRAEILDALSRGPIALSTAFGGSRWGRTGDGHVILVHGVTADGRNFIVSDPAGDYFSRPTNHYGATSCGRRVLYPIDWVVAFTSDRWLLEIGDPTADPSVLLIKDVQRLAADAAQDFWLQDSQGRRTGWLGDQPIEQIPDSQAVGEPRLISDPFSEVGGPSDAEALRTLILGSPPADLQLFVQPSAGGYRLDAKRWEAGDVVGQQTAAGSSGGLQSITIPAVGIGANPPTTTPPAVSPAGHTGLRAAALKKCKKLKNPKARKKCKKKARRLPL